MSERKMYTTCLERSGSRQRVGGKCVRKREKEEKQGREQSEARIKII